MPETNSSHKTKKRKQVVEANGGPSPKRSKKDALVKDAQKKDKGKEPEKVIEKEKGERGRARIFADQQARAPWRSFPNMVNGNLERLEATRQRAKGKAPARRNL